MFFALSKLFYQCATNPVLWVMAIWVLAWWWAKKRKLLLIVSFAMLWFFSNQFIAASVAIAYQPKPVFSAQLGPYSCGILLGGMTSGTYGDSSFINLNADRLVQTIELYHQKRIGKILITGATVVNGKTGPNSEALFVCERLVNAGVRRADVIIENKARNTYENAVYTRQMLDSLQLAPPYLLISSAIHIPRSMHVFRKAGLSQLTAFPCNYLTLESRASFENVVVPQIYALYIWQRLLKEWVGLAMYRITGKA